MATESERESIKTAGIVIGVISVGLGLAIVIGGGGAPLAIGVAFGTFIALSRMIVPALSRDINMHDSEQLRDYKNSRNLEDIRKALNKDE